MTTDDRQTDTDNTKHNDNRNDTKTWSTTQENYAQTRAADFND